MLTHRRSVIAAIVVLGWLPVVVYWASRTTFAPVEVDQWLGPQHPARQAYQQFLQEFGDDQTLVVTWPGCRVDDTRLQRLARVLRTTAERYPELGISRITDSAQLLEGLREQYPHTERDRIIRGLAGRGIGPDGTACITLRIGASASEHRSELIRQVRSAALAVAPELERRLVLAGEPIQSQVIDQASRRAMLWYAAPSAILALVVAWLSLRGVRLTLVVFALSGLGQLIGLALVAWVVGPISALLVVVPTLIFMLTLSSAVHLASYYRKAGGDANPQAGIQAVRIGLRPCLLAAATSAFGFLSLLVSHLQPVAQFGGLAAGGVVASVLVLVAVFPSALRAAGMLWTGNGESANSNPSWNSTPVPVPETGPGAGGETGRRAQWGHAGAAMTAGDRPRRRHATAWMQWIERRATGIVVVGGALLAGAVAVLFRIESTTEFTSMFPPGHPAVHDLLWVEQHVGPVHNLEFVVRFSGSGGDSDVPLVDQMAHLQRLEMRWKSHPAVVTVMTAASLLPPVPRQPGIGGTLRRAALKKSIEERLDLWQRVGLVHRGDKGIAWRASIGTGRLEGKELQVVQTELDRIVRAEFDRPGRGDGRRNVAETVHWYFTGISTVMGAARNLMIDDLATSFTLAFVLITPAMIWVTRSWVGGILLMIPNVLPVAIAFGTMGWLGIRLDVASLLTASIALGIAVDDTLHLFHNYAVRRHRGADRRTAVYAAVDACAPAMLHTTWICAASMLPFFFSDFLPTSKFASLLILILLGAIAADLVVLPALLLTPLGRCLDGGKRLRSPPSGRSG